MNMISTMRERVKQNGKAEITAFASRASLGIEMLGGAGDRARLAQRIELARRYGVECVACGDVHMHIRERRALQDTLTAIRHKCTLAEAGYRLFPNGERHLRSRERLARIYPPELLAATIAIAERCDFSLDSLPLRVSRGTGADRRDSDDLPGPADVEGRESSLPGGNSSQGASASGTRTRFRSPICGMRRTS